MFALGAGAIVGPAGAGLAMDLLGPDGFLWDLALIHGVLVAFGAWCIVRHPTSASEEHGRYVVVASGTSPLGTAWTEEAGGDFTQLELALPVPPVGGDRPQGGMPGPGVAEAV